MNKKHILLIILASLCTLSATSNTIDTLSELMLKDIKKAEKLFKKNNYSLDELGKVDDDGYSLLHYAALQGSTIITKSLLEKGISPNIEGTCEYSPLHFATVKQYPEICGLLIQHGAIVDSKATVYPYVTSLISATSNYDKKVYELLLQNGASPSVKFDVKEKEIYNITPLHLASHENNGSFFEALSKRTEIAATLVKYDSPINDVDSDGKTPLHYAVEYNHTELIKLFLKNGANPTIKDTYDLVPGDYTKEKPIIAMLEKHSKEFQK